MATNVRRKVKCPGCGVYFYRDEEENVLIKNRYWHKLCYQQFQIKNEKSAQAIIELDNYICKLFDLDYVNARIKKQIKALEYIISIDTNETDKEIHKCALKEFKNKLKSVKRG